MNDSTKKGEFLKKKTNNKQTNKIDVKQVSIIVNNVNNFVHPFKSFH